MYGRLTILTVIIAVALCGLTMLGYHAIGKWAEGLEWKRLGEFAAVAEQIRQDVKSKLDGFMQIEENRPYTDDQYYYVPESVALGQEQMPLLRSPLGNSIENSLAYGNFQIEPEGNIATPYYRADQSQIVQDQDNELFHKANAHLNNIKLNLFPALSSASGAFSLPSSKLLASHERKAELGDVAKLSVNMQKEIPKQQAKNKQARAKAYTIKSFQKGPQAKQIFTQQRSVAESNVGQGVEPTSQQAASDQPAKEVEQSQKQTPQEEKMVTVNDTQLLPPEQNQTETVQITVEPFVPLVIPGGDAQQSIFGGQVFLLRRVQVANKHFLQGFQLNEKKLVEQVKESAEQAISAREGMSFELSRFSKQRSPRLGAPPQAENENVAYAAILDFGLGELVLNLKEINPAWISNKINWLRNWYFTIISIVLLAVTLGLASLWRNAQAQIKLAQKKDDFISAVSHELRTPLTSIRMYSEMLEKNWVKSEDKLAEYYRNMRQESERLSRLIENVLDFSRIQRGQKKYTFSLGNINECIADVVEIMTPYAVQSGFSIKMDLEHPTQTSFDGDAVTQIVVNLLDNAIKYARDAEDKTITIRTRRSDDQFILIEVEDHGPGVPHRQQKKIFEEFYRSGAEATRETTGTGLGLALVKKFAQAHNGFVEIITAKPTGAIFRVTLAAQM
ncbi:MAG: sensor histidine kinase [Planctomycetota bacterium]|jgi:signal transduction histidine kinase